MRRFSHALTVLTVCCLPVGVGAQFYIDDCGYLLEGVEPGCVLFASDHHGDYLVSTTGAHDVGDYVWIAGVVDPACLSFCMQGEGCLWVDRITSCSLIFSGCGYLAAGTEAGCILFNADEGGLYLLEDYDRFGVGDRVYVAGMIDSHCYSSCMQEDACIVNNDVASCCCLGSCGDIDGNGSELPNVGDIIYLVDYLFRGGAAPPCEMEANVDGHYDVGAPVSVGDLTYLIQYLFQDGTPPASCP